MSLGRHANGRSFHRLVAATQVLYQWLQRSMIAVVRCSSFTELVAVTAWMLESIHDVYSYEKHVARSVVVLLACAP